MRTWTRIALLVSVTTLAVGGLAVGSASAGTGSLELIATDWGAVSFSDDGSRAVFISAADGQVYAKDFVAGTTTLVSTADGTTHANGYPPTSSPQISRNGRFVTFITRARNLDPADTDFASDVYLKDLEDGSLTLVSTNGAGQKGNQDSQGPAPVSDDGTVVVFASRSGNFEPITYVPPSCLQPEETLCAETEIYAKNLATGTLTLLTLGTRGDYVDAVSGSVFADVSADGMLVAIGTMDGLTADDADNFPGETNGFPDIFVRNLTTGETLLASNEGPAQYNSFYLPSLSADGSRVAFQGTIHGGDPVLDQVFVRDLGDSAPALVSQTADGQAANGLSVDASLSGDGQFVAFMSAATNLDPGDLDSTYDAYLTDLQSGGLRLVSQTDEGTKGTAGSQPVQAVNGGSSVLFSSTLASFDPFASPYAFGLYLKRLTPAGPADANGDGVVDSLQPSGTADGAFADASTSPVTTGSIVDRAWLTVTVSDESAPDGVLVTVGAGTGRATLSVCGMTVRIPADGSAVLTCGSLAVRPVHGDVTVELDAGAIVVTVPEGASAEISDTAGGAWVSNVSGTGVTVAVNGATTDLEPGSDPVSFTIDGTPPSVTPAISGLLGDGGWYTGDVAVSWTVTDDESAVNSISGCDPTTITTDTPGSTLTCTATSTGGTATQSVTIKRDATDPEITSTSQNPVANGSGWNNTTVTLGWTCTDNLSGVTATDDTATLAGEGANQSANGTCTDNAGNSTSSTQSGINIDTTAPTLTWGSDGPAAGGAYYFGAVPPQPTCTGNDSLSGVPAGSCIVTGYGNTVGSHTLTASVRDNAGNATALTRTYRVRAWTLRGFYQPVDMNGVYNVVKGGSTVPFRFEVFAGTTEKTTTTSVASFTPYRIPCTAGPRDAVEVTSTSPTSLRYDTTAGQFIQNWKIPTGAGTCYRVVLTTRDGSTLTALFQLK